MSKKLKGLFREKITNGELPLLYAKPRFRAEEDDSAILIVNTIEIEAYQTPQQWGGKGMRKRICKMLKKH